MICLRLAAAEFTSAALVLAPAISLSFSKYKQNKLFLQGFSGTEQAIKTIQPKDGRTQDLESQID